MTRVHVLADDLTGALDSAAAFGCEVPVFLDSPPGAGDDACPVSVVATATRDVPIESLPRCIAPALPWLRGGDVAFKKVDSLLRGNTFAEVAYCARAGDFRGVVFAPAFPRQGRVTIDGRQWVMPPGASSSEREPVGAGSPADAFAVLGLAVSSFAPSSGDGLRVWIPDVASDEDLGRVASRSSTAEARRWLWCGSAGLAHAIAAAHGLAAGAGGGRQSTTGTPRSSTAEPGDGPVLLVSASHHPVVRRQWDVLRAAQSGAVMVTHGQQAALRSAFRAMGHGFDFAMFDLSPSRLMSPAEASALLARQLEAIVHESPRPSAVVVVGGDTLRALCRAAGARSLLARAAKRVGWGRARLVGGAWDGLTCHTRSGAFGDPDDLTAVVRDVIQRTATAKECE